MNEVGDYQMRNEVDWDDLVDTTPAQLIAEELEERGWDIRDLVGFMGPEEERAVNHMSVELVLYIDDPRAFIGPDLGAKLDRAFGLSEGFFDQLDRHDKEARANRCP